MSLLYSVKEWNKSLSRSSDSSTLLKGTNSIRNNLNFLIFIPSYDNIDGLLKEFQKEWGQVGWWVWWLWSYLHCRKGVNMLDLSILPLWKYCKLTLLCTIRLNLLCSLSFIKYFQDKKLQFQKFAISKHKEIWLMVYLVIIYPFSFSSNTFKYNLFSWFEKATGI